MTFSLDTGKVNTATLKVEKAKEKLKQKLQSNPDAVLKLKRLNDNPDLLEQFSTQDKADFRLIKNLLPDLFKDRLAEVNEPLAEKLAAKPLSKTNNTITSNINKLGLAGLLQDTGKALTNAADTGYLPDMRDKNILGVMKEQVTYPLNKLLQTLSIFPRTEAELASQAYKKGISSGEYPEIADFNLENYDVAAQAKKNLNPANVFNTLNIGKEGWKEVGKAAIDPIINNKSEYANKGFTDLYDEMYAGTKFTEPFKGTENWENGNFWQRLASGFAGSPADIAGLASDIIFDPTTYFGGGLGKGAKTGINLTEDLIINGDKVLSAGAEVGLTKIGRQAFETAKTTKWGRLFEGLTNGTIAPNKILGITGTDEIAKQTALNIVEKRALNKFLQQLPDAVTANKYIDFGGLKFMGDTVIKGQNLAKLSNKFKNNNLIKTVTKLFNENAGIPNELVPFKNWLLSAGDVEKSQFTKQFANIVKDADKYDLDKIQKYLWIQSDVERQANRLDNLTGAGIDDIVNPIIDTKVQNKVNRSAGILDKYTQAIQELNLTDKQLSIADSLKAFWKSVADQFVSATGKDLKAYDFYTPIRYIKDEAEIGKKSTLLGAVDQPFVKARNITMAQAEKLGLKPKDLVTSTMQRLYEQEKNVFRSRLLDQVKQFGSDVAQKGMNKIDDIPELKGFYLPDEYHNVLKKTYSTFFGDDATNKLLKVYDKGLTIWKRWALATPGYHFRNFFTDNVSGLMEYGTSFYNPKYWSDMGAVLKQEHKLINLNGVKRYADDVYKEMLETGEIALTTQSSVEGKLGNIALGNIGKVENVIKKVSPAEYSLKAGNVRENAGRVVAGLIERDNGASKIMAAANVKKVFFDYANSLTPFERNIVKRAIPFYTWLKNNARRQLELIFTRTGAYSAIPKVKNFVENISETPEGYDEFKPDYYKDLGVMATPLRQPGLPDWLAEMLGTQKTTQAGDMLAYNPNLAFQDWSKLNIKDLVSSLAPQIKVPIELLTDTNIYYGSKINEGQSNKEVSKPIAKALGLLPDKMLEQLGVDRTEDGKILISPRADYLLKQLPIYALTQRGFAGTDNSPYQNLSALAGIKFFPYNEEKAKETYTKNWQKQATEKLNDYEQVKGADYKMPTTTQINSAYKEAYKNEIDKKYADTLQLKELLDVIGSNKEMDAYVKELLKPYYAELDKTKNADTDALLQLLKDLNINLSLQDIEQIIAQRNAGE